MSDLENHKTNHIVTPESLRNRTEGPVNLWIYTKKYGETSSSLKPGFAVDVENKFEDKYEITVPESVIKLAKEVERMGGRALLVGGCVRDTVMAQDLGMDLKPKDIDIEVYGLSTGTLNHILELNYGTSKAMGESFGVIKVPIEDMPLPLDVSIPRRDSSTGSGHKEFLTQGDPSMSITEGALRRDLTFNSLAYDPLTQVLYDPYDGVKDIHAKVIRVTDKEAFAEDPLRVLRIMQFSARFHFGVDDETMALCKKMVHNGDLDGEPRSRITEEMKKLLLKSDLPSVGLEFANEVGIVERYWPELHALIDIPQEPEWHPEGYVWTHTLQVLDASAEIAKREKLDDEARLILMLSAIGHDFGKATHTQINKDGRITSHGHEKASIPPMLTFLDRFEFPKDYRPMITALIGDHMSPKTFYSDEVHKGENRDNAIRRLAKRLGDKGTNIKMLSLLVEADQRGRNGEDNKPLRREEVSELEEWQSWLKNKAKELKVELKASEPLLQGRDVMPYFNKNGPWVGVVLKAVYQAQLGGELSTAEDALQLAERMALEFSRYVRDKIDENVKAGRALWDELKNMEDPREVLGEVSN